MMTQELFRSYLTTFCVDVTFVDNGGYNTKCMNCEHVNHGSCNSLYCEKYLHIMCVEEEKQSREEEAKKLLAAFIDDYGKDEAIKLCGDFIETY